MRKLAIYWDKQKNMFCCSKYLRPSYGKTIPEAYLNWVANNR